MRRTADRWHKRNQFSTATAAEDGSGHPRLAYGAAEIEKPRSVCDQQAQRTVNVFITRWRGGASSGEDYAFLAEIDVRRPASGTGSGLDFDAAARNKPKGNLLPMADRSGAPLTWDLPERQKASAAIPERDLRDEQSFRSRNSRGQCRHHRLGGLWRSATVSEGRAALLRHCNDLGKKRPVRLVEALGICRLHR